MKYLSLINVSSFKDINILNREVNLEKQEDSPIDPEDGRTEGMDHLLPDNFNWLRSSQKSEMRKKYDVMLDPVGARMRANTKYNNDERRSNKENIIGNGNNIVVNSGDNKYSGESDENKLKENLSVAERLRRRWRLQIHENLRKPGAVTAYKLNIWRFLHRLQRGKVQRPIYEGGKVQRLTERKAEKTGTLNFKIVRCDIPRSAFKDNHTHIRLN
jgi:hypothetical protein